MSVYGVDVNVHKCVWIVFTENFYIHTNILVIFALKINICKILILFLIELTILIYSLI